MQNQLTHTEKDNIIEVIKRLTERKKQCFISPNNYYIKGQHPTEYNDVVQKIIELKKGLMKQN